MKTKRAGKSQIYSVPGIPQVNGACLEGEDEVLACIPPIPKRR